MGDGGKSESERERKRTRRQSCWSRQGEARRGSGSREEEKRIEDDLRNMTPSNFCPANKAT